MKIEVGTKYKVEDVWIEGVHSRREYVVTEIDKPKDKVKARCLQTGKERELPFIKDGFAQRSLTNSINRGNETGWVFTIFDQQS